MSAVAIALRLREARLAAERALAAGDTAAAVALADEALADVVGLEASRNRTTRPAVPWTYHTWRTLASNVVTARIMATREWHPPHEPARDVAEVRILAEAVVAAVDSAGLTEVSMADWPFPQELSPFPPEIARQKVALVSERVLAFFRAVVAGELGYPATPPDLLPPTKEDLG